MVLLTDGVLDRNGAMVDVPAIVRETAESSPREVVHALGDAVLEAIGGDLRDDSTILCLDRTGHPHPGQASDLAAAVSRAGVER